MFQALLRQLPFIKYVAKSLSVQKNTSAARATLLSGEYLFSQGGNRKLFWRCIIEGRR
ncbi:hypothetical protein MPL3365_140229 [Mesorhizobium plurifarium]|uniref:Uncharacterized protein n=1 Tax=Mesorhizobium plurifarium TaxID=69974 RepID=A0A090G4M2_MESPL|nr:hypothetical protein MPL3365_140229 [Mesorhizobium plurifarium]